MTAARTTVPTSHPTPRPARAPAAPGARARRADAGDREHVEETRPDERAARAEAGRDRVQPRAPVVLHVLQRVEDIEAGDPGADPHAEDDRRRRDRAGERDC